MKLNAEDAAEAPDDFVRLMAFCSDNNISINNNPVRGQLTIIGTADPSFIQWVQRHYAQCEIWLPGTCDGCCQFSVSRTESFWGAHPHFCNPCKAWTIEYFDRNDKWPEGNWFPGEGFDYVDLERDEEE